MAPTAAAVLIAVVSAASASTIAPFLPYSFQAYNALEDYKVARVHATNTDAVAALGDVFMRHAVNDTFGLCLLHRHFKVRGGEVMVEVVRGNATRTEPRVLPTWEFSPTADVVPSVMGVTANGSLVPYEFLDVRESDFGAVSETTRRVLAGFYSRSEAFTPFFVDLASALDAAGLRSAFGVCVRHRDSVTSADPGGSSMETNHPRERWLRLDPMAVYSHKFDVIAEKFRRGESTATFWSFPLRCNAVGMGVGPTEGFCAECGCGGGMCAECACATGMFY